eukprot:scpid66101/ scgid6483/ 
MEEVRLVKQEGMSWISVVFLVTSMACTWHGAKAFPSSNLVHGWDCVACSTNTMLAGDFGHTNSLIFNMSDQWWIKEVALNYAAVTLNSYLDSNRYNGSGESGLVTVARAMKAVNPKIKLLFYEASQWVSNVPFFVAQLQEHEDWWLKDDYGNIVWFHKPEAGRPGHPYIDLTVPEAQKWFANAPLSLFKDKEEAKALCDGLFVDGAGYRDISRNISAQRYRKLFEGKMQAMQLAQQIFTELNGGEVWGNAAMEAHPASNLPSDVTWNTTMQHFNGGFDEMFGSFSTQNPDGSWNVSLMERSFETIINVSNAGHSVVIHAFPGPATVPFVHRGETGNSFTVPSWKGSQPVPTTTEGCRQAAAKRLVESLAPFLIVANERVFLSYAWFYSIEDGYIPCKAGVECGMPSEWYPEFTRPLGPPKAAATRQGTVWTREFEHASVYVDLADRSASRITWS